jgi:hypothetical protein
MHEHRARVDELLDLESGERAQQPPGALHIDLLVERVRLAGHVEERGEVDHRRDARAAALTDGRERFLERLVGSDVGSMSRPICSRRRALRRGAASALPIAPA